MLQIYTTMFILLVLGHFVADYVFQTDSIATGKNKTIDKAKFGVNWQYWLFSHASTHALVVYIITQNIWACLFELATHYIIDYFKCIKCYGLHVDQLLHIVVKVFIAVGLFLFA